MSARPLLEVRNLAVAIQRRSGPPWPILDDVSFTLAHAGALGVVGESGSGKSTLALALIGLLPDAAVASGSVLLDGTDLLSASEAELCRIRGRRIGMVFQEPMSALNPAMTVGRQIEEAASTHRRVGRRAARLEAMTLLDRLRIPDAVHRFHSYPHELSGGQRQRVGIAIALAGEPAILLADEPTTALDVTTQAEILDLLAELTAERGTALVLVSHDLGVVARATRHVMVLYAGTRFESGPTHLVLEDPLNPYTRALIGALPRRRPSPEARLATIPGAMPRPTADPNGCRFGPRCAARLAVCDDGEPAWTEHHDGRGVRCIRAAAGRP